ncbi:pyrroline-5-carboxylate reductase [Priestia koreensis]|uniref:pyrroline-5-carboxylate reductase n=1 Tax=Priestia koreensis TaxID=284581 RepID=UPI001F55BB2A|nr:pyrroline-5-carboxylate reductase [Priestia koreensis]MCM3005454.1 pyrroline-5-carboxylate reductase [Priestia koreensis]UNL86661.1 pyrroline-5-carboxylate reductase [Priestia koreensis]
MLNEQKVAFLGAGSMAEAMISGMVSAKKLSPHQIIATNKSNEDRLTELQEKYGITAISRDELVYEDVDVFILAMKPKDADAVLVDLKDKINPNQLVMSVLAGISTEFMEVRLHDNQPIIRVMPNTSSMMQESATAISTGQHVGMDHVLTAKELLSCIGEVYVIEEEKMDIFTGIAGSGPAYFYYLMEHIEKAAEEEGMPPELARQIGAQTILGAAKMIMNRDETPSELRENVTSPNGTTAAGLDALAENGGGRAIMAAVKGASSRSKEISKQLEKVHA